MDRELAREYVERRFAALLDEANRLGIMFHVIPPHGQGGDGHIIHANEMKHEDFPVLIEVDEDATDRNFRDPELDREGAAVAHALSYALANLDDLNEAYGSEHAEATVQRLLDAYRGE